MTNAHMQQWVGWTALLLLLSGLPGGVKAESPGVYGQTLFVPVYIDPTVAAYPQADYASS